MEFIVTKEQKELKKEIVEFATNNLNEKSSLEKFDKSMWDKVSEFGIHGITIGEEYGGLGESYTTAAIAFEALGYSCLNNGLIFAINNHIWVSTNLIYLYGSQQLKDKYLADMVSGKKIGAICITESDSGTDAMSMRTNAIDIGEGYILNGNKMFVSNGPIADIFIVFAITKDKPNKSITAFVVEKQFKGVRKGEEIRKMGLGACPTCEIILQDCKVPKENVLGALHNGAYIMLNALEWERCFEFAPNIGTMQRIMERCIEHVKERTQFGKPIGEYQSISNKISEMKIAIEMSKNMLYKIAWLKDSGKSAYIDTSIFKYYVSNAYIETCRDAIQIFGGYGYSKEYDFERELRDALGASIYSGTNELQLDTIYKFVSNIKNV